MTLPRSTDFDHVHYNTQIRDTNNQPWNPSGGSATLEEVLAEGNETGENTIVMPMGVIDGKTTGDDLRIHGLANPLASGDSVTLMGGVGVGVPAAVYVHGGQSDGGGGWLELNSGDAGVADAPGGDIVLTPGPGDGTGRDGLIFLNLPTANPAVAGALWADSGVVKVSAG